MPGTASLWRTLRRKQNRQTWTKERARREERLRVEPARRPERAFRPPVLWAVRLVLVALFWALPVWGRAAVVIEIDPAAERLLDARAARRLVALELDDVDVPATAGGTEPALFYRVLVRGEGLVRVELWELGEMHDARVVSGAQGPGPLVARRVALAAAELARGLRQRRLVARRREAAERERAQKLARAKAERTQEGPLALRSSLGAFRTPQLTLFGPALHGELNVRDALRFDLGARLLAGGDDAGRARLTWWETSVGPAHRFHLTQRLDLDASAFATLSVVQVAGASAVDAIPSLRQTWSARAGLGLRLQPRLTRFMRASIGAEGSLMLRAVPARFPGGAEERYRHFFVGGELGVVITLP